MSQPEQGEVWWADLPEPVGRRPVLILTRGRAIPLLSNVTVAPLTRSVRGIASEVELTPSDGVPSRSAVSLDNILTIPKSDLLSRIACLRPELMNAVFEAIHHAFDLPF